MTKTQSAIDRGGSSEPSRRTIAVVALGVFVAAFAFHGAYAFHGLPLYDGGILLDGADRILRGEVFARDFHAPYGPGSYFVLALWFAVFGPSVASWTWLAVTIQAGANAALFALAARWTTPGGALLTALLLAVAHGSLHKSFLLLALCLALAGAALLRPGGALRRDLAAGALAGGAFLFRYDVGVFAFVALCAGAVVGAAHFRGAALGGLRLAAGWAAPVAAAIVALLALGASPASWWEHTVHRFGVMQGIRMPFPWPWSGGGVGPLPAWLLMLAFAIVLAALLGLLGGALVRRWRGQPLEGDPSRVAIAVLGLLALNQTRLLMGINRLFQVALPAYLALGDLLSRRARGPLPRAALVLLAVALVAWVHTHTRGIYPGSYTAYIEGAALLDLERGGVRMGPGDVALMKDLVKTIRDHVPEGQGIGVALRPQLVPFLAERPLALPYSEPAYYLGSERFQREAIAALEAQEVRVFVRDRRPVARFTLRQDAPLLADYVEENYRLLRRVGPFEVLRRGDR